MHHNQATLHFLAKISFSQPQEEAASLIPEHSKWVVGVYGIPQIRPAIGTQILGAGYSANGCVNAFEKKYSNKRIL